MKNNRKLKHFLINPRYQIKYAFWITLSGLFFTLLNAGVFYKYTSENYESIVKFSPMSDEVKAQLYSELDQIVCTLTGFSIGFLVLVALLGIMISHKTAGPLYRFKIVFDQILDGKTDARIKLRPGDEFRDVAESFNKMMDKSSKN